MNGPMLHFLKSRWFLLLLVILIAGGLTSGVQLPAERAETLAGFVNPRAVTALVLFLMAFSLDNRQLKASFRSPQ